MQGRPAHVVQIQISTWSACAQWLASHRTGAPPTVRRQAQLRQPTTLPLRPLAFQRTSWGTSAAVDVAVTSTFPFTCNGSQTPVLSSVWRHRGTAARTCAAGGVDAGAAAFGVAGEAPDALCVARLLLNLASCKTFRRQFKIKSCTIARWPPSAADSPRPRPLVIALHNSLALQLGVCNFRLLLPPKPSVQSHHIGSKTFKLCTLLR